MVGDLVLRKQLCLVHRNINTTFFLKMCRYILFTQRRDVEIFSLAKDSQSYVDSSHCWKLESCRFLCFAVVRPCTLIVSDVQDSSWRHLGEAHVQKSFSCNDTLPDDFKNVPSCNGVVGIVAKGFCTYPIRSTIEGKINHFISVPILKVL